jgi:hypothetical protein
MLFNVRGKPFAFVIFFRFQRWVCISRAIFTLANSARDAMPTGKQDGDDTLYACFAGG